MLQQIAPYFGYLATLLLAIGLLVNSDMKFRWLNTSGNIAFIVYGIFLQAIPVILTNCILLSINIYFLIRIYNRKEHFELLEFGSGAVMIDSFISFYKTDIAGYFPEFTKEQLNGNINFVVLRNLVIANIFSARMADNGTAEVLLNYTVPKYRDYKVGPFIFEKEKQFMLAKGIKRIVYTSVANPKHEKFLKVTGFSLQTNNGERWYIKHLTP
jgi:hypothetical protein